MKHYTLESVISNFAGVISLAIVVGTFIQLVFGAVSRADMCQIMTILAALANNAEALRSSVESIHAGHAPSLGKRELEYLQNLQDMFAPLNQKADTIKSMAREMT